jgi:hypothetical protein
MKTTEATIASRRRFYLTAAALFAAIIPAACGSGNDESAAIPAGDMCSPCSIWLPLPNLPSCTWDACSSCYCDKCGSQDSTARSGGRSALSGGGFA